MTDQQILWGPQRFGNSFLRQLEVFLGGENFDVPLLREEADGRFSGSGDRVNYDHSTSAALSAFGVVHGLREEYQGSAAFEMRGTLPVAEPRFVSSFLAVTALLEQDSSRFSGNPESSGGHGNTETDIVVTITRRVIVAICRTEVRGIVVPTAAPQYPVRATPRLKPIMRYRIRYQHVF